MFNETSFLSDTPGCQTIRDMCLAKWPDDGGDTFGPNKSPSNVGLDKCLTDNGYWKPGGVTKCFANVNYDLPGATTYPVDVVTNPNNPNTIWQIPDLSTLDLKSLGIGAGTGLLIAGAIVVFLLLRR